jgi:hypothetical protein
MSWDNVPDDWNSYYYSCGCHASEGGCSCPEGLLESAERPWLADSGYELDDSMVWLKDLSFSRHTARRDHVDGKVKRGDRYTLRVYRCIEDEDGSSWIHKRKRVLR